MKNMRKVLVLVLAFAMIVSLAACAKKPIDYKDFRDILEDDFDFEVEKGYESDDVDKSYIGMDEDGDFHAQYTLYEDIDDAEDEMEDRIDDIEDAVEDEEFDGKVKKTESGDYQKITINGEHEDDGDLYMVLIRAEDMIIMVGTDSTRDKDVDKVNDIVKALGY